MAQPMRDAAARANVFSMPHWRRRLQACEWCPTTTTTTNLSVSLLHPPLKGYNRQREASHNTPSCWGLFGGASCCLHHSVPALKSCAQADAVVREDTCQHTHTHCAAPRHTCTCTDSKSARAETRKNAQSRATLSNTKRPTTAGDMQAGSCRAW